MALFIVGFCERQMFGVGSKKCAAFVFAQDEGHAERMVRQQVQEIVPNSLEVIEWQRGAGLICEDAVLIRRDETTRDAAQGLAEPAKRSPE